MKVIQMQDEYLYIDKNFETKMNEYRYKSRYKPKIQDY
jgi:hypothetical protein